MIRRSLLLFAPLALALTTAAPAAGAGLKSTYADFADGSDVTTCTFGATFWWSGSAPRDATAWAELRVDGVRVIRTGVASGSDPDRSVSTPLVAFSATPGVSHLFEPVGYFTSGRGGKVSAFTSQVDGMLECSAP